MGKMLMGLRDVDTLWGEWMSQGKEGGSNWIQVKLPARRLQIR